MRGYAARMTLSVPVDDEVMDFSSPRKSLPFRVDDDLFHAAPDIAAELAIEFSDAAEKANDDSKPEQQIAVLHAMFNMVLFPESAERFIARLRDPEHPIGMDKLNRIVRWLFESYGLRPTTSDSPSSSGSDVLESGTNSTVSTSDAA